MELCTMHFIIVAYETRVRSSLNLVKLVKACGIPYLVVRNKCDKTKLNDKQKAEGKSLEEEIEASKRTEQEELTEEVGEGLPVFFVAADAPASKQATWGPHLAKLKETIEGFLVT